MSPEYRSILSRLDDLERLVRSLSERQVDRQFFTPKEFAARVGLSSWYLRKLIRDGAIQAERLPNGRLLIPADEAERVESRRDALQNAG